MRKILAFILVAVVIASGCLEDSDNNATSDATPTTISSETGFLEELGKVSPSDPLCGMNPNVSVSHFIDPLREDYSISPAEPEFPVPGGSLAGQTLEVSPKGVSSKVYVSVFAYPDSYSATEALAELKEKLNRLGNSTDEFKWEGKNALYSAFTTYFGGFYLIVVFQVPYGEDGLNMAEYALNEVMFHVMWVGPSPEKMLGLFMHTEIVNKTGRSRVFSGDLLSESGFTPEGARIEVAVYREGCGQEVYRELKSKIEKIGFTEKSLPPLNSRDPAGKVVERTYFEGNGGVYIELYDGPGMDRVMLLYGNESAVKAAVQKIWSGEGTFD
ncbi:hypothetical protein [Thermococcus pacificus]|uniref:Uncharacterized protein n=1 Tax=Thermococcus pacificus TaxID=71998 RepID=A0A218P9U1_9EURY|nr:hypothetical protein [Thermococcus pacificus]ASJ07561.1 hypothetical protein A3L08_09640 [Thermococcus pacificus]